MLKKYYTCSVINKDNIIVGSGFVKVWIWNSPECAYDALNRDKPSDHQIINFTRVK